MKKGMILFSVFMIVFLIPLSFAWSGSTHNLISLAVLQEKFPDCMNEIKNGSTYPDSTIKDFVNHHCGDNAEDCKPRIKAKEWLSKINGSDNCSIAFNMAVASHYLADAYSPVHWNSFGDCHSQFEGYVNKNIEQGRKCWKCILNCIDKTGTTRNFIVNNSYIQETANNVAIGLNLTMPFDNTNEECAPSIADFIQQFFDFISEIFHF